MKRPYIIRVLDWITQGLNTVLLNGSPDESTSGRAYRECVIDGNRRWCRDYRFINALFFWQDNHCKTAYEDDIARARRRIGE